MLPGFKFQAGPVLAVHGFSTHHLALKLFQEVDYVSHGVSTHQLAYTQDVPGYKFQGLFWLFMGAAYSDGKLYDDEIQSMAVSSFIHSFIHS